MQHRKMRYTDEQKREGPRGCFRQPKLRPYAWKPRKLLAGALQDEQNYRYMIKMNGGTERERGKIVYMVGGLSRFSD